MSSSIGSSGKRSSAIAFLPIKPQYAHRIVSGEKRFEFRKATFASHVSHIVIYASTPVKKIVGVAEVSSIDSSSPSATWESTKHAAGISRSAFRAYFLGKKRAYSIALEGVRALENWVSPNEIEEGFKVPQSFAYVGAPFLKRVLRKGRAL
jgi:predicted transcriptional regulator